ncbi:YjbQ family protein [Candidatus Woesearchaeota archaeon]|nr:MAG: YjbQ family protein [Candidatus Woesearchaeota archaeon]
MQFEYYVESSKKNELIDIRGVLEDALKKSGVKEGLLNVYAAHATAAIIINENYDPNICLDFLDALNNIIPEGKWRHDQVDNNAAAHIKSAIVGPSETIPIKDGKLQLGTWQSPMLCDFDGPRKRKIIITLLK